MTLAFGFEDFISLVASMPSRMDIVMPIRDGIEATDEIKDTSPDANVVMCTSVGQEEKMKEAVKAGADGYITKPFQKPSVMEAIQDVVPS